MKLIKSNWAKKLIIILIALMIFNLAVPQPAKAWDLAGVLMKPLFSAILGVVVSVDVTLGLFLTGIDSAINLLGGLVDAIMELDPSNVATGVQTSLQQIFIGPDSIFSGKVEALNANIFDYIERTSSPDSATDILQGLEELGITLAQGQSKAGLYSTAVAKLYIILRNVCALVMLAGLIYTGIRILITANIPTKKTQYLMILQDWLVGLSLLVFSHLIMILVFKMSDALTEALGLFINGYGSLNLNLTLECLASFDSSKQLICIIMLGYMVWLTIIFAIAYAKRFFWVCLLIIMAPVFATLYAFGQQTKSIYSRWLKEYLTIVLIQPFHMLVYSVLVAIPVTLSGQGFSLANINGIIYSLGAMSMIRPAEKYLRSMFGMDQGLASVASYESGKQTFDAIKKVVATVGKVVIAAAATVATGGAAAPVAGKVVAGSVAKGAIAKGAGSALTKKGSGAIMNKVAGFLRSWKGW